MKKTLLALAIASAFAISTSAVFAEEETKDSPFPAGLISATEETPGTDWATQFDLIAEGEEKKDSPYPQLVAEDEKKQDAPAPQLIAEGEDKGESKADLIAEGEDKGESKADLIA